MGITCSQINMPSCNSLATIPPAASLGATHAEPGHSLTGTNPDNLTETNPLKLALLYMSEISHHYENRSYCFGGGHYRRSKLQFAAVKTSAGYAECPVKTPDSESIDYYFELQGNFPVGTPVVMSFRTQIFVTRSRVAAVSGLSHSQPSLLGIWDSQGRKQ
jgi:predicted amino acid racemase